MIRLDLYQSPVSAYLILLKCRGRRGLLSMQIKILMIKIRRLESEHRFALFDGKSVFKFVRMTRSEICTGDLIKFLK